MDIVDKVILITGGAGGIGIEMVRKFLESGAKGVAIVDICENAGKEEVNKVEEIFGKKKAIFVKTDITIKKELVDAFEATIKTYNQLDIVINNAGIVNESDWKLSVAVNLTAVIDGTYLAMTNYLLKYKSSKEGVIVNIASVLALQPIESAPVYCSTKNGVIGLGRAFGGKHFYNKYKVRILTLCPGLIRTTLTQNSGNSNVVFPEYIQEEIAGVNPLSQSPSAVAEAVIEIIQNGKNGSIWVTEDRKPMYEIGFPHRLTMKL